MHPSAAEQLASMHVRESLDRSRRHFSFATGRGRTKAGARLLMALSWGKRGTRGQQLGSVNHPSQLAPRPATDGRAGSTRSTSASARRPTAEPEDVVEFTEPNRAGPLCKQGNPCGQAEFTIVAGP